MKGHVNGGLGVKTDRKITEKNRRLHMKALGFKLSSLIPKDEKLSKDALSQHDHLDNAASYINTLRERIERLKHRKKSALEEATSDKELNGEISKVDELNLPAIEVRYHDSALEVVLVSGLDKRFLFHEVIAVLEEEGAEVVNASFSVVDDKIFYTIHSQVISSKKLEVSRVSERLRQLI